MLSLTFDNLGEAAELEIGALPAGVPLGGHITATEVVPELLDRLAEVALAATFFVEGLNTEIYPELLQRINASGHEVAYHAWRHEDWAGLPPTEQADNLARGLAGFERLGLRVSGLRPPGGSLGPDGLGVLRQAGLRYCSPAGEGAGEDGGVALLPFQWRHVDASCVLPPLADARVQMTGSPDPVMPTDFLVSLERSIDRLASDGGYLAIVLHPFMLAWLGDESLTALLDRIATAVSEGDLRVARCDEVADHVLAHPDRFAGGTTLDATTWA